MLKINYEIKERNEKVTLPENLGFGQMFTDHIFEMDYDEHQGWHNASIKPFQNLSFHPSTMFMHYGQAIFEGMKAFKNENNEVFLFRPDRHFERLNNSARRLCMPEVDISFLLEALKELIHIEKDWIPTKKGEALYIRPYMLATDTFLGVRPSKNFKLLIILAPVGAYYPQPVKILIQDDYVRAVRKGIGECKTSANYAAGMLAAETARQLGFNQVLWLDGIEQKYIEEVGTMNIFIRFKDEVATPMLTGSILPGVTRESVIHILKDWEMNVTERLISVEELISEYDKGNVLGVFGTGTAAVISSVGQLAFKNKNMIINNGQPGELALKLYDTITSIQHGHIEDKYNWLMQIKEPEVVG